MAKMKFELQQQHKAAPSGLLKNMMGAVGPKVQARMEGHPLSLTPIVGGGSGRGQQMGLNMDTAPIPPRRYSADLCKLSFSGREAKLIFGQISVFDESLESALVIRMNPDAVMHFADSMRSMINPTLDEVAKILSLEDESLSTISSRPLQTVSMVANVVGIAVAGHETTLDFYHASAFAIKKSQTPSLPDNGFTLEVEPVVRVDMRTSLFIAVVNEINEIERIINKNFPSRSK